MIHKPKIVDEHLYEFVGGTTKVLRNDLLAPKLFKRFKMATINLCKNRNDKF